MCGGGGSSKPKPAPQAYRPNPNAVADTSNDALQRQAVVASTAAQDQPQSFGSQLGTGG